MGKNVTECASSPRFENIIKITAGVDIKDDGSLPYPVYKSIDNVTFPVDCIVDFSHPSLLDGILDYAVKFKTPVVIATTGHTHEQLLKIEKTAETIPVFHTANMAIGINLINELLKKAVAALGSDFDIEIVEKHHNRKLDAPSGTAIMLADTIKNAETIQMKYVYDRHAERKKRDKNEIGIHSIRGGTIVGEHDVIFAGEDEVITISHSAGSRKIFAVGALRAAEYIADKSSGLYDMAYMMNDRLL